MAELPLVEAPADGTPVVLGERRAGEEAAGLGQLAGQFRKVGAGEEKGGFQEVVEVIGAPGRMFREDEEKLGKNGAVGLIGQALDIGTTDTGGLGNGELPVLL